MAQHFDLAIIGTGSGNSLVTPDFEDKQVAIIEERHLRRHLPQRRLHPDQDVRLRRRRRRRRHARPAGFGVDATLDGVRWKDIRDRDLRPDRPDLRRRAGLPRARRPNTTAFLGHARFTGAARARGLGRGEHAHRRPDRHRRRRAAPWSPTSSAGPACRSTPPTRSCGSTTLPARHASILGGGYIAAEFAHVFSAFGVARHAWSRAAPGCCATSTPRSPSASPSSRREQLGRAPRHRGGRRAPAATRSASASTSTTARTVEADLLLVATGREPNTDRPRRWPRPGSRPTPTAASPSTATGRTSATGVWALGDVCSPLPAQARRQPRGARRRAQPGRTPTTCVELDHRYVPAAVFTHPQIASVGLHRGRGPRRRACPYVTRVAGLRRHGVRLGDGGHHQHLQADRRPGDRAAARRAPHGAAGVDADPAADPGACRFGHACGRWPAASTGSTRRCAEVVENALLKLELAAAEDLTTYPSTP